MTTQPLVSICLPTYNGEAFLDEALSSALAQTYRRLEFIVSDDASEDRTLEIVGSFAKRSSAPFRLFHHTPRSPADNWNNCIEQAQGEFVKFLFQDDLLEPECVERLVDLAQIDPDIGLVYSPRGILMSPSAAQDAACRQIQIAAEGVHTHWSTIKPIRSSPEMLADPMVLADPLNKIGEPSAVLVRHSVFRERGGFDPNLRQMTDTDMWLRILSSYKVGFVDKILSHFRIHLGQQTRKNIHSGEVLLDSFRLFEKVLHDPCYRLLGNRPLESLLRRMRAETELNERLVEANSRLRDVELDFANRMRAETELNERLVEANSRLRDVKLELADVRTEHELIQTHMGAEEARFAGERERFHSELQQTRARADGDRETLNSQLLQALDQVDAQRAERARTARECEESRCELQRIRAERDELYEILNQRNREIAPLIAQTRWLGTELAQREARLAELYASKTWRWSAPFRQLLDRFQK